LEELEPRLTPSTTMQPSVDDQVFLERLNAARANPAAYGASVGVNLSNVAPSEPLAFDPTLIAVATAHSQDMSDNHYFGHVSPTTGLDLNGRLTAAGYPWTSYGESIAAGFATPQAALAGLIIDTGIPDLGHRLQLLSIGSLYQGFHSVGVGIVENGSAPYVNYFTIDTGKTANNNAYLTGVVYKDLNHNAQYDAGEGLSGVTIAVQGGPTVADFVTGGYSVQLAPGTYTVTFSGGGLPAPITKQVTIGTQNVELDITPQTPSLPAPTPAPTTPPSTPQAGSDYVSWVSQLGQRLLKRPLTTAEVNTQVGALQKGASTDSVVSALVNTPDYSKAQQSAWVAQTAQDVLHRSFSAYEQTAWVNYLQGGGSQTTFVLSLLAVATNGQPSTSTWLNQLSQGLLHRNLTTQEMSAWLNYLQGGGSRVTAVSTFLNCAEYQQVSLTTWLNQTAQNVLGRPLTAAELTTWLPYLENGGSRTTVVASLVQGADFTKQYLKT
jgi:uncharacterized protein YkwD